MVVLQTWLHLCGLTGNEDTLFQIHLPFNPATSLRGNNGGSLIPKKAEQQAQQHSQSSQSV
jgi:hypothetical protein